MRGRRDVRRMEARVFGPALQLLPRSLPLLCATNGEDGLDCVPIPLMAGKLEDLGLNLLEANGGRPGFGPRRCVLDGDVVLDRVRGHAREAFNQMQILGWSPEVALGGEVARVDDARGTVPS